MIVLYLIYNIIMRRQNLASILTSGGQTTQSINFQKEMIHKL